MTSYLNPNGAFIHIPKTGGSWVSGLLRDNGILGGSITVEPHHIGIKDAEWAFCVLREPTSWWASHCAYQSKTNFGIWYGDKTHPLAPILGCGDHNPEKMVRKCLHACPTVLSEMYRMAVGMCDYVLDQANLVNDMARLVKIKEWDLVWRSYRDGIVNRTDHGRLSAETRQLIRDSDPLSFEIYEKSRTFHEPPGP